MDISGSSKIPYYEDPFKEVLESLIEGDTSNLAIKLDSRANVKSSFGKFIPAQGQKQAEIRIYTGAIDKTWEDLFRTAEGFETSLDILIFTTVFLLQKYLNGQAFEVKTEELQTTKDSKDYLAISENFSVIKELYNRKIESMPQISGVVVKKPAANLSAKALDTAGVSKPKHKTKEVAPQVEQTEDLSEFELAEFPESLNI